MKVSFTCEKKYEKPNSYRQSKLNKIPLKPSIELK